MEALNSVSENDTRTIYNIINKIRSKSNKESYNTEVKSVTSTGQLGGGIKLDNILRELQPPLDCIIPRKMVENFLEGPVSDKEKLRLDAVLATFLIKTNIYKKDVRVRMHKKSDKTSYIRQYLRLILSCMDRQQVLTKCDGGFNNCFDQPSPKRGAEDDCPGERKVYFHEWLHEASNTTPKPARSSPAVPDIGHMVIEEMDAERKSPSSYESLSEIAHKRRRKLAGNVNSNSVFAYYNLQYNTNAGCDNLNSNTRGPREYSSEEEEIANNWISVDEARGNFCHSSCSESDISITDYLTTMWGSPRRSAKFDDLREAVEREETGGNLYRASRRVSPYPKHVTGHQEEAQNLYGRMWRGLYSNTGLVTLDLMSNLPIIEVNTRVDDLDLISVIYDKINFKHLYRWKNN